MGAAAALFARVWHNKKNSWALARPPRRSPAAGAAAPFFPGFLSQAQRALSLSLSLSPFFSHLPCCSPAILSLRPELRAAHFNHHLPPPPMRARRGTRGGVLRVGRATTTRTHSRGCSCPVCAALLPSPRPAPAPFAPSAARATHTHKKTPDTNRRFLKRRWRAPHTHYSNTQNHIRRKPHPPHLG